MAAVAVQSRTEQLNLLRRQMAAVSGKDAENLLPDSAARLPIPPILATVLPDALPRGTVAVLSGARSLPLSMVAAATAAGQNAAIVGQPDIGLLAAVEMGADLSRLAVISDPGADPVEVAAVLMDGMDLVVLGLGGHSVPLTRARAVTARAHQKGCTLLIADGDWQGASLRLAARVCGYEMTGSAGFGRIRQVRFDVRARGRTITRSG
jgi:beta-phosphoglucomutase-like phosphatase (HAD superfamily)